MSQPLNLSASNTEESDELEQFIATLISDKGAVSLEEMVQYRESDQGKRFTSYVHQEFTKAQSTKSRIEKDWAVNMSFVNRKNEIEGAENPSNQKGVKKVKVNRIRSIVRTEVAKLTSQLPQFTIVPASSEPEDMLAAYSGEQVVQSYLHSDEYRNAMQSAALFVSCTGNGFVKTYWDPSGQDDNAKEEGLLGLANTEPTGKSGRITIEHVAPFNIFVPDPRQEDIEKQPFVIHAKVVRLEEARVQYKEELAGKEIQGTHISVEDISPSSTMNVSPDAEKDSIVQLEIWIKPGLNPYFPEGGHFVYIDKILVSMYKVYPYKKNKYPFAHFGSIPTGTFWRASTLDDLIPLQIEYNENVSMVRNTRHLHGRPMYRAQKGSITPAKVSNRYGTVIEYKGGTQPLEPMPTPELPRYIFEERQQLLQDMEDLSGQHQVSKGTTPPGVTAATAISFLQERDDSYISPTYRSLENGIEKIGKAILALAIQYWSIPRMVKTVGRDQDLEINLLKNTDLGEDTDLRVETNSSVPYSRAAKNALYMDLVTNGIITPEQYLELSEIGGVARVRDNIMIDKRQAMRENITLKGLSVQEIVDRNEQYEQQVQAITSTMNPEELAQAEQQGMLETPPAVPVNEWDEHATHIKVHNDFRKSQEFATLPPEIQEEFDKHVKAHEKMQQQKMLKDMLSMIPTDGTVPGIMGAQDEAGDIEPTEVSPEEANANSQMPTLPGQGTVGTPEEGVIQNG